MSDSMTPAMKAAAFHGVALNVAYPMDTRLAAALDALAFYEAERERLQEVWVAAKAWVTAPFGADMRGPTKMLVDAVLAHQGAEGQ